MTEVSLRYKNGLIKEESCSFIMFNNIKPIPLHCVFHGIRFKVNEDWVSGIDTLLFLYPFFLYEYA